MAGASMNDIKARIKSVKGTMQITKAMELVASSKLRRAKEKAEKNRPYFNVLNEAISNLESYPDVKGSVWSAEADENKRVLYIVIAGDRGLAGGYNANIFRLFTSLKKNDNITVLPIGKKAYEYFRHRNYPLFTTDLTEVGDVSVGYAHDIAYTVAEEYERGEYGSVVIIYTKFVSMLTQNAVSDKILPLSTEHKENGTASADALYEGEIDEIMRKIIPQYIAGIIHSAVCDSLAAESAARRSAMNAANKNAGEIVDSLMLKYNRARQAIITQEITEIVSGAEAL